jgi:glycosidase
MIDRFNNPTKPPASGQQGWNRRYGRHQGGSFNGIKEQLHYLKKLGVGAIWITPVVKNPAADWEYNYHGLQLRICLQWMPDLARMEHEQQQRENYVSWWMQPMNLELT